MGTGHQASGLGAEMPTRHTGGGTGRVGDTGQGILGNHWQYLMFNSQDQITSCLNVDREEDLTLGCPDI